VGRARKPRIGLEHKCISDGAPSHICQIDLEPGPFTRHVVDQSFFCRWVRWIGKNEASGSRGKIVWDGRDDDKQKACMGIYVILLESIDERGGVLETAKGWLCLRRDCKNRFLGYVSNHLEPVSAFIFLGRRVGKCLSYRARSCNSTHAGFRS